MGRLGWVAPPCREGTSCSAPLPSKAQPAMNKGRRSLVVRYLQNHAARTMWYEHAALQSVQYTHWGTSQYEPASKQRAATHATTAKATPQTCAMQC